MVRLRNEDLTHLRFVSEQSSDDMKHFVMGMIAVAMVLSLVIGSVLLSDVLLTLAAFVCSSFDFPTLFSLN